MADFPKVTISVLTNRKDEVIMKKNASRLIAVLLVAIMLIMTGCEGSTVAPGSDEVVKDTSKTQLIVATYDGGLGDQWIVEAGKRFEEKYANVSFEEGKMGVQVRVLKNSQYGGDMVLDTLQTEDADVWFTESVNYSDHINYENLADITDIVTEKLTEFGEEKSIADKMDSTYRDFLNVGTDAEPLYYAIPFYDGFYGLAYDKDLFAVKNLYFKHSGSKAGDGADDLDFVASAADTKSAGVDGKLGTYDDGMPATYAQFLRLIDEMVENEITPIVYGGANAMQYPFRTMTAFWAQAEGEEGYMLNNTFDGEAQNLVVVDANGNLQKNADGTLKTETVQITAENGYDLQRQISKYYVLELFEKITANGEYYSSSNLQHTAAQSDFLKGVEDQFTTYGLLIDGSWWENEADESFKALATRFGEDHQRANRNLGFMPLPVPTAAQIGQGTVLLNQNTSLAFIRSTSDKIDCAKAFLQFTSTDAELSAFTASVSMTRSLNYELVDEHAAKTTEYGKSLYEAKQVSKVIYPYSEVELFQKNQAFFSVERWSWQTTLDNSEYTNPWLVWLTFQGQYDAQTYFSGMYKLQKTRWGTIMK